MATPERLGLLNDESPAIPTPATTDDSPSAAQRFSVKHRPGYARVPSVSFSEDALARDITDNTAEDGTTASLGENAGRSHGLGIALGSTAPNTPRVSSPLSQQEARTPSKPISMDREIMNSPPTTGGLSGSTRYDQSFGSEDTSYAGATKHMHKDSRTSLSSTIPASIYARSEASLLPLQSRSIPHDPTRRSVPKTKRLGSWVSITILSLAFFSTIFSIAFLIIGLRSPRWGQRIRNSGGDLTPSSAAFLTSLIAKMIELSFVTIVVAFVGQALARRAAKLENARGITLAEMSMRQWVMQPGTMLTQWESVKYAAPSVLGFVCLVAASMAVLYTSAATALVQPQLKFPDWRHTTMAGLVKTKFANSDYILKNCKTPIQNLFDPAIYPENVRLTSCLAVQHAALAYHNYHTWLGTWTEVVYNGTGSGDLAKRPPGYALQSDNTTITAPWIEQQNVTSVEGLEGRWINNVTMAMPHTGIISAAQDPVNRLMQPGDLDGASINIIASVPNPMLNVLCVTMTADDLKPFVYELWDEFAARNLTDDELVAGWPHNYGYTEKYLNGTPFDDVFGWGEKYGPLRVPPVFARLPMAYNTIVNTTYGTVGWGRDTIFILGRGPPNDYQGGSTLDANGNATNYAICQLQVGLTTNCSTRYSASSSGGSLSAHCEDETDKYRFDLNSPEAMHGLATVTPDWPDIAGSWATSLSLNDGIMDANASNARILTEFILTGNPNNATLLNTGFPSLAEALAVLAGCTLIDSITDAPFVSKVWNYTIETLVPGQYQYFNALVQDEQYISGGSLPYQKVFFVVLVPVVIMNVIILGYFLAHRDWYTDLSEPMAMFSIAVNSPPSEKLAGSARGPSGDQYRLSWKLNEEGGHFYYVENDESREGGGATTVPVHSPRLSRQRWTDTFEMIGTPGLKSRFSR